jgi:hypothetical protein
MPQWRCEACDAVYEQETATCTECDGGLITRHTGDATDMVTDNQKVETFDAWGVVDWLFLGLILSALTVLVFALLQSAGGL